MKLKNFIVVISSIFIFSLTSCNKEESGDKTPSSITIIGLDYVPVGFSVKFSTKIKPVDASLEVTWKSDDDKIASVNEYGLVTGVNDGTTLIKAISKKNSKSYGSFKVTVYKSSTEDEFCAKYKEFYDNFMKNPVEYEYAIPTDDSYIHYLNKFYDNTEFISTYNYYPQSGRFLRFTFLGKNSGATQQIFTGEEIKNSLSLEKHSYELKGYTKINDFYYVCDEYVSRFRYCTIDSGNIYEFKYSVYDNLCYYVRGLEVFNGLVKRNLTFSRN